MQNLRNGVFADQQVDRVDSGTAAGEGRHRLGQGQVAIRRRVGTQAAVDLTAGTRASRQG